MNSHHISQNLGLWISPNFEILNVKTTHIAMVINNPQLFFLTSEFIIEIYKNHNEPLYLESSARKEIILSLIEKGWIRIRRYRTTGYSINIARYDSESFLILSSIAKTLLTSGLFGQVEIDRYFPVYLNILSDKSIVATTLQELSISNNHPEN